MSYFAADQIIAEHECMDFSINHDRALAALIFASVLAETGQSTDTTYLTTPNDRLGQEGKLKFDRNRKIRRLVMKFDSLAINHAPRLA